VRSRGAPVSYSTATRCPCALPASPQLQGTGLITSSEESGDDCLDLGRVPDLPAALGRALNEV